MKIIFLFSLISFSLHAQEECKLTRRIVTENLKLSFNDFDQDMNGGFRKLANKGCYFEAANLIDIYNLHNKSRLEKWQVRASYWHAGQLYASANEYSIAKSRFLKSYKPNELPNDTFKWNTYVNATIAFIDGDKELLINYKDELLLATDPAMKPNLDMVKGMIKCFGRSYSLIGTSECYGE